MCDRVYRAKRRRLGRIRVCTRHQRLWRVSFCQLPFLPKAPVFSPNTTSPIICVITIVGIQSENPQVHAGVSGFQQRGLLTIVSRDIFLSLAPSSFLQLATRPFHLSRRNAWEIKWIIVARCWAWCASVGTPERPYKKRRKKWYMGCWQLNIQHISCGQDSEKNIRRYAGWREDKIPQEKRGLV